jgi:hypothetical protein
MPYEMKPARTGSANAKAALPMSNINLSLGDCEKSGPVGVIGAKAIAVAIKIPPQAMNGTT